MTFYAALILFLLVMDPLGGIPFFIAALKKVPEQRKKKVIAREMVIALGLMVLFMFQGAKILKLLSISGPSLTIAGGIILLLIAIKMIFPTKDEFMESVAADEPLIVPLAIPYVSGPSALITVSLVMSKEPLRWKEWLLALLIAWFITGTILIMCTELERILGERGVIAIERLMGMILTAIAVEMTLNGITTFLTQLPPG